MKEFITAHKDLDFISNLIQISMDGPHVNWAFHRDLNELRLAENPVLLEISSCGLLEVYGVFGIGVGKTNWAMKIS